MWTFSPTQASLLSTFDTGLVTHRIQGYTSEYRVIINKLAARKKVIDAWSVGMVKVIVRIKSVI